MTGRTQRKPICHGAGVSDVCSEAGRADGGGLFTEGRLSEKRRRGQDTCKKWTEIESDVSEIGRQEERGIVGRDLVVGCNVRQHNMTFLRPLTVVAHL